MNRQEMPWGYRGMDSKKASVVKKAGHKAEYELADIINVPYTNIITGTGKTDLINQEGKRISLKSSHDRQGRSQICLYSYNSDYFKSTINGSTSRMKACLAVFPETLEEYKADRKLYKNRLQGKMIELQRYINADMHHKREFLEFIFLTDHNNKKIDFVVIMDSLHNYHVFEQQEFIKTFCDNTIVKNSKAICTFQTPNLKVLFKGKNAQGKYVNLIENEIRTSTHYRKFLSVGNKTKYLYILKSNIKSEVVKKGLLLYGKANYTFRY